MDIHSLNRYGIILCHVDSQCFGLGLLDDIGRRELEAATLQGEQTVWHINDETCDESKS